MESEERIPSSTDIAVSPDVLERMRCTHCSSTFRPEDERLVCSNGHSISVVDGYLDASTDPRDEATARTLQSFGYEWSTFDKIQAEDERFWHRYFTDVPPDRLLKRFALDAGCGKGRFSFFAAPCVGHLVALDGSDAVGAAVRNLRSFDNVTVVRSDLAAIPFGEESFDFIWCLGVLHHLSDPEAGFRELVARLAPGGDLLIYVYSRPSRPGLRAASLAAASALRRLTVAVPHPLLRLLCAPLSVLLYAFFVVPGWVAERIGTSSHERVPLQTYRGRPVRSLWLDTFDRLSAPIENRYVWADIEPWFRRASLTVESVRDDAGLIVLAHKPEKG